MGLLLNTNGLKEIMVLFHALTEMRIVIFDSDFNEILSYPEEKCPFCSTLRNDPEILKKCIESDVCAFKKCKEKNDIIIYRCHAGLTEAAAPIKNRNRTIGYLMFGQITEIKNKEELERFVDGISEKYGIKCETDGIKYRSDKQVMAAAKLLEMCTEYILLKEMVDELGSKAIMDAKEYINRNLSRDIYIDDICRYANTGRTKMYELFMQECGTSIAAYIKEKRLSKAYELLRKTDLSVAEISDRVGFSDYNYFSRVFKKKYGFSPWAKRK